jgi:hypothetical protein
MPLQNRVMPDGRIIADSARGTMMGNRGGVFHCNDQTLKSRHWASKQWICCVLQFKGRHRPVMTPRHYTELFFLDEATALASGHRPCFECRRADAIRFAELWAMVHGGSRRASAPHMDDVLHLERCSRPNRPAVFLRRTTLPDGVFIRHAARPYLHAHGRLWPWSPAGYGSPIEHSDDVLETVTPPSIVAVLAAGYRPTLHLIRF